MNRLLIIAALLIQLTGCNENENTQSPPSVLPTPPSISTPLPLSGFVLQPTIGQHDEGDFTRLRPSKNANRFDYVDIKVSMDELDSAQKVQIDFRMNKDKNGILSTSFFIASGNPEKLDDVNGLYFFKQLEFIYECGQSAEFDKISYVNTLHSYTVTINSQEIDETQCLINYMQTASYDSYMIEITTKNGLVTSVNNLDTGIIYDTVDKNYSPF